MSRVIQTLMLATAGLLSACAPLSQRDDAAANRAPVASGYQQLDKGASLTFVSCRPCVQHTPKTIATAPVVERARIEPKPAEAIPAVGAPSRTASGPEETVITAVHFDSDSARLDQAAQDTLKTYCQAATSLDGITVTGYTDATGSTARNHELARQRASSASQFLRVCAEQLGKPIHVDEQAKAACCHAASNDTAQGRAMNRRADVETRSLPPSK